MVPTKARRSITDGTVHLSGVNAFEARLDSLGTRCAQLHEPLTMMLVDVDEMHRLNHALGSATGDRILTEVATALASETLGANELFHFEGDSFAMLLPETDTPAACVVAGRCRAAVTATAHRHVTVSIGIAEMAPGHPSEEVIANARLALEHARESGGDCLWRADDPRRHGLNPKALSAELTDREWMVVGHLVRRRTEEDIAARMGIKPGTVRSHKSRIRRKLHVQPDARLTDFAKTHFTDEVDQRERVMQDNLSVVVDLRD